MDTKTLITNLHSVFCTESKGGKKYTKVWLSPAESFGFDKVRRYILNVQAEHEIDSCNDEIREIVKLLNEKAKTELQTILRIDVHHLEDDYYCQSDELIVYEDENSCQ